jgi:glutathione S-transferase
MLAMTHTLYATFGSGNSYKPFLAMKQLGIPFRTVLVDVVGGQARGPMFRAINPAGTVPYLVMDDGRRLGESNAIAWFLTEGTSLEPATRYDRAQALQWMHFEQGSLEPFISPARFFIAIVPEKREERAKDIAVWQTRALSGLRLLDGHLAQRDFIAGRAYSVADIAVFGYVHTAGDAEIDLGEFPAIGRWIERVCNSPRFVPLSALGSDGIVEQFGEGLRADVG